MTGPTPGPSTGPAPGAGATGTSALRVRDLWVQLGGTPVLRDVTLDVRPGEWLGLIGPNGAGKSTLLRTMAGLVTGAGVTAGAVTLADGTRPRATDLALMPQAPTLPAGMSVIEYVLLGRTAHLGWLQRESRRDRDTAIRVLRRLDLAGFAARPMSSLSGGEAQRVAVARSLAQQAPVLLLDEPTSSLDVGHQVEVLELVDELRRSDGLTVVAAMHDLGLAARYADRLLLLDRGLVVACDEPAVVLQQQLLSQVYGSPLQVHELDGQLVVVPAPRPRPGRPHAEPTGAVAATTTGDRPHE